MHPSKANSLEQVSTPPPPPKPMLNVTRGLKCRDYAGICFVLCVFKKLTKHVVHDAYAKWGSTTYLALRERGRTPCDLLKKVIQMCQGLSS